MRELHDSVVLDHGMGRAVLELHRYPHRGRRRRAHSCLVIHDGTNADADAANINDGTNGSTNGGTNTVSRLRPCLRAVRGQWLGRTILLRAWSLLLRTERVVQSVRARKRLCLRICSSSKASKASEA